MRSLATRGRHLAVSSLVALAALLPVAPPAAASDAAPVCADVLTDDASGVPHARVTLCVDGHTGLYDPVTVTCTTIYGCWARVTVGHTGTASLEGTLCVEALSGPPLCVALGTGEIPLVSIPPQSICFNDSPWGPPCQPEAYP